MKHLVVIVSGTGQPHDLEIQPGTTAGDVLKQIGLTGYVLQKNGENPFGETENIYPRVEDGEKLYANSPATVGRLLAEKGETLWA